jgi:hypothetical protein
MTDAFVQTKPPMPLRAYRHLRWRLRKAIDGLSPDPVYVRRRFRHTNGVALNLERPRDFAEKILWLSLFHTTPLHRRVVDKIAVRDFVREVAGEELLVPALLITRDLDDIDPERIAARRFAVKTNHDSGGVVLCRDRDAFDWEAARETLRKHLAQDYYRVHRERMYRGLSRGLLVEAFLDAPESAFGGPYIEDFKFYCFNGEPRWILHKHGPFPRTNADFYDCEWRPAPFTRIYQKSGMVRPKPRLLDRMLDAARRLSAPFPFVRVDLFEHEGQVRFGELTFVPDAGFARFEPLEWERKLGDLLELPEPNRRNA